MPPPPVQLVQFSEWLNGFGQGLETLFLKAFQLKESNYPTTLWTPRSRIVERYLSVVSSCLVSCFEGICLPLLETALKMLNIGDIFPNFIAESTLGKLDLYNYLASSWGVVFSHPKDFTPVCTTELGRLAVLQEEFEKRDVKVLGLSVDTVQDHVQWTQDIAAYAKVPVRFPLMADPTGDIAKSLGILDKEAKDSLTVRAVFVISPDRLVKAVVSYPSSCGRNFSEILRLVDSLQHTQQNPQFVTPVEWQKGDEVIVKPGLESVVVGTRTINLPSDNWLSVPVVQQPVGLVLAMFISKIKIPTTNRGLE